MTGIDWATLDGLAQIKANLSAQIAGWLDPVAYAVGLSSASSSPEWDFPRVNAPGGRHGLPAVILATVLGHDGSTTTLPLTVAQLEAAVRALAPAEACTDSDHPNLSAWRSLLADASSNPARELVAVFVSSLDDPVSSEADGAMRATFEGHAPAR